MVHKWREGLSLGSLVGAFESGSAEWKYLTQLVGDFISSRGILHLAGSVRENPPPRKARQMKAKDAKEKRGKWSRDPWIRILELTARMKREERLRCLRASLQFWGSENE